MLDYIEWPDNFPVEMGILKTETLKINKSDIEELNQLVRDYSERTEDDVVHIQLEKANLDKHEADKLIELLEERTIYLPLRRGIIIKIKSPDNNSEHITKEIRDLIREHLIPIIHYIDLDQRRLIRVSALLMIFGVLAMGTASLLSQLAFNAYSLHEILVITSWVFIWAAVEMFFFDRRKLKNRKHRLQRIYFAEFSVLSY